MGKISSRQALTYVAVFVVTAVITAALAALLINISNRKIEAREFPLKVVAIEEGEIDPAVWGQNFPHQYDSFDRTREDYGKTKYGGSTPYSKLEAYPAMVRLWAGYSFSKDHNEERGHHYAQIDQGKTRRVTLVDQPGACVNCHAAEVPALIAEMGWENFNRTPYNDLKPRLTIGSSCADCHDPETMDLRITRPALKNALEARGIDLAKATRQEMRAYVCAQCHVEYYFLGENKVLTLPWSQGTRVEEIEAHYDDYGFSDWKHADTGAGMIKVQHPEFEMWGTGIHARSGVSCADCHMPFVRVGSVKTSDHWVRSPLNNPSNSCGACHNLPEEEHLQRVETVQDATAGLLRRSEEAIIAAIDAISLAREAGVPEDDLAEALEKHRAASLRWDFVSSENSTGFHSPQEAARILAGAIDLGRQAEMEATAARLAAGGR